MNELGFFFIAGGSSVQLTASKAPKRKKGMFNNSLNFVSNLINVIRLTLYQLHIIFSKRVNACDNLLKPPLCRGTFRLTINVALPRRNTFRLTYSEHTIFCRDNRS